MTLLKLSSAKNLKNFLGAKGEYEVAKNHNAIFYSVPETEISSTKPVKLEAVGTISVDPELYALVQINPELYSLGVVSGPQVYTSDAGVVSPFVYLKPYQKDIDLSELEYLLSITLHG